MFNFQKKNLKNRTKPQLSNWISQVVCIVWPFSNIFLIELSPDYGQMFDFGTYLIWFLIKASQKTVFHVFQTEIFIHHLTVCSNSSINDKNFIKYCFEFEHAWCYVRVALDKLIEPKGQQCLFIFESFKHTKIKSANT